MHLDTRKVITEVEKRPDLWDPSDSEYCFVEARMESWKEVCRGLFHNFDEMHKDTRSKIVTKVRQRWNTARTAYMKVQKHRKNKSLAMKPYICTYYHRLVFLDKRMKLIEERERRQAAELGLSESQPVSMIKQEELDIKPEKIDIKPEKSTDEIPIEIIDDDAETMETTDQNQPMFTSDNKVQKKEEDDYDFLMSFLPMLKKLDEDQKLQFRLEAMRLLIRVRNGQSSS